MVMRKTYNRDYWNFWRLYKTKRGATNYARKHTGTWVILDMNPDLLTREEKKHGLGTWLVGRSDEYLFYQLAHGKDMLYREYKFCELYHEGNLLLGMDEKPDAILPLLEDDDELIRIGEDIIEFLSSKIENYMSKKDEKKGSEAVGYKSELSSLKSSLELVSGCVLRAMFLKDKQDQISIKDELSKISSSISFK